MRPMQSQPQQRFADVTASIGNKQQEKTDKKVDDEPTEGVELASGQSAADIRDRDTRSGPKSDPATDAHILSGQMTSLPVRTEGDDAAANSVPIPIPISASNDASGAGRRPAKAVDGVVNVAAGGRPIGSEEPSGANMRPVRTVDSIGNVVAGGGPNVPKRPFTEDLWPAKTVGGIGNVVADGEANVPKGPLTANPWPAKTVDAVVHDVADHQSLVSKGASGTALRSAKAVDGTASAVAGAGLVVSTEPLGTNLGPANAVDVAVNTVAGGQPRVSDGACDGTVSGPPVVQATPGNVPVQVAYNAPVTHSARYQKTETQAAQPVLTDVNRPSSSAPQKGERQHAAAVPHARPVPGHEEGGEPTVVTKPTVERTTSSQTERNQVVATPVPSTPSALRPLPKDDSSAPVQASARVISTAGSVPQDQPADPQYEPQPNGVGPRLERQPRMAQRRQDPPAHEHRPVEIAGSEGKKDLSVPHTDTANGQEPPPAATLSQPLTVSVRGSFKTQPDQVMNTQTLPNPVRTVGQQILDSVQASASQGDREISVRLQPPELGTITVRLREEGGHLEGVVEVDKRETRREIERALPEVVRGLQDMGVQVRKFDVTGSDSSRPDLGRGQPQQDGWSGQNGSGQSREQLPTPHTPWRQETVSHAAPSEETARAGRLVAPSSGRIDMLL